MVKSIGLGVIGMGWMGVSHARAHSQVRSLFPDYGVEADLVICADENEERAKSAQARCGFRHHTTDWRQVLERDDVDLVCITVPNFLHKEIVEATARAKKHMMCEKPVGRTPDETIAAAKAVADAGVNSAVGYNYRWSPVVQYARDLIKNHEIGEVRVYNGRFFSLYGSDPLGVWSWRYSKDLAGTGAIGDLLTHVIDMAHWLNSPIRRVNATMHTFIPSRPSRSESGFHYDIGDKNAPKKEVTNEDYVSLMAEFENGARGVLEASRSVYGPKCELAFDVYGDKGAISWDFEKMNELQVCLKGQNDGFTRVQTSTTHPFHDRFNPGDAIAIGYLDLKTIEAAHFLKAVADGKAFSPGMREAAQIAKVSEAIIRSADSSRWEDVAA